MVVIGWGRCFVPLYGRALCFRSITLEGGGSGKLQTTLARHAQGNGLSGELAVN
jgi:hypothetical protein